MKEYSGYKNLTERGGKVYCPKCGNYLKVVDNGWFHGELFYCPIEKNVFCITLRDITKKSGERFIASCEDEIRLEEIKRKITLKNMDEVGAIINLGKTNL